MKKSTIIIIGVIVIAVLWCISAYNGMVTKQEGATTALADVQATYQRRADLLPNLTKTVKAYAKHEKETFEAVTKARTEATQIKLDAESLTPEKLAAFQKAQGDVSAAFGRLMAIAENYPELKASENFKDLQGKRIVVFCVGASPYEEKAYREIVARNMTKKTPRIMRFGSGR